MKATIIMAAAAASGAKGNLMDDLNKAMAAKKVADETQDADRRRMQMMGKRPGKMMERDLPSGGQDHEYSDGMRR